MEEQTIRAIIKIVRKHVDQPTLNRIVDELLDEPGNKSFRDTAEVIAREARLGGGQ